MKKQNSRLFAKFEDAKILAETAKKINGGLIEATSMDGCTNVGGNIGGDCTDNTGPNGPGSPVTYSWGDDVVKTKYEFDSCE